MLLLSVAAASCRESTAANSGVHERWYAPQAGIAYTRPAVAGTLVFIGTGDGLVIARDKATGAQVWTTKVTNGEIGGANMVVRGGVVAVALTTETVGLDITTGLEQWRYAAPPDTVGKGGAPAQPGQVFRTHIDADAETVFIPAWGASVSAVDMSNGAVRWVWQSGPTPSDTAVAGVFSSGSQGVRVSGDTVFATAWHFLNRAGTESEAWLVALDRLSGRELWRAVVPTAGGGARVWGAPVISGELVIFESAAGHEYAINRNTQQMTWQYTPHATNGTDAETELYDGVVYHDGGDQNIYALRASDGSLVWRAPFATSTSADLLVTERRVIFSNGPTLFVFDRRNGKRIVALEQPHTRGESFFASPAAYSDGQVFITVGNGAWSFDEP